MTQANITSYQQGSKIIWMKKLVFLYDKCYHSVLDISEAFQQDDDDVKKYINPENSFPVY